MTVSRHEKLARSRSNCKAGDSPENRIQEQIKSRNKSFQKEMFGERSPHSCLVLPALAPHCPTNLCALPETVRSGTGS
jgi:hypothetical protein